jgi:S-DNA-T family DNA segregation ATPase FtsK/SpoIIIE
MADLAKMPHLLIAGTTGSGKSVALNTMILSLLYRIPPEHCRIFMIDPKMLELSVYDNIPHLLAPVVIDPKKAVVALKWAVREMEQRYAKMAKIGARGVEAFNDRVKKAKEKGEVLKRTVHSASTAKGRPIYEDEILELEPMPFTVVVVDEMADLMMISGKEIEGAVRAGADGARGGHSPDRGNNAAAVRRRHHGYDQGELPDAHQLPGDIQNRSPASILVNRARAAPGPGDMLYMMAGGRTARARSLRFDSEVEEVVRFLRRKASRIISRRSPKSPTKSRTTILRSLWRRRGRRQQSFGKAVAIVARERKVSTSLSSGGCRSGITVRRH